MTFGMIIYTILIGPLELFFEVLYTIANRFINNYGLSIIVLSLIMNFLVLPLYKRADAMQAEERDIEAKLHKGVTHIKKTFSGNERMMMLQTYYRQNNYKPTDVIKGSVSLFLEIPFFIAAYRFLSNLSCLKGVSFGPIHDLGAQDGLLYIFGNHINIMPIIMTLINLISCVIYTKGFPRKTKIQLYGMALFFLLFLYASPAGLVFYWTLNNLFSLVKTIFYKLKNPKKVLTIMSAIVGTFAIVLAVINSSITIKAKLFMILIGILLVSPVIWNKFIEKRSSSVEKEYKPNKSIFLSGSIFSALLIGALIPSAFINASPLEFVDLNYFVNPIWYIVSSLCYAIGLFLVWIRVFYWLANDKGKCVFEKAIWIIAITALINYMFFGKNMGVISSALVYDKDPSFSIKQQCINILVIVLVIVFVVVVFSYLIKYIKGILFAAVVAILGMSIFNIVSINSAINNIDYANDVVGDSPYWTLSKNGKNVVVIMLDRSVGAQIPYMMNEKPELKEQFSGFTYYSNVVSFGAFTNIGTPALYGGYEYTPVEMNKREDELLEDKQNEALKVMPVLFYENNYNVTVCDPTYAGYSWIPDLSIYDDYPGIHSYITNGYFSDSDVREQRASNNMRNFFCFSFMKSMPLCTQNVLYNYGAYNASPGNSYSSDIQLGLSVTSVSTSEGQKESFLNAYNVLVNLPSMTKITEDQNGSFNMLSNDITHEVSLLQEPNYEPANVVDNTIYDAENQDRFTLNGKSMKMNDQVQVMHYQSNMAAFIQLGKWFDYLRENGVYDNTRIIIVSDHGRDLGQFDELLIDSEDKAGLEGYNDTEYYYPTLLVKDFGETEYKESDEFMTNADVVALATNQVIDNPINPFTGVAISNDEKTLHPQYILASGLWDTSENNGYKFLPGTWLSVEGNRWDRDCWNILQTNSTSPFKEE